MTPKKTKSGTRVYAPQKLKRSLKILYILLGIWGLFVGAWLVMLYIDSDCFSWGVVLTLGASFLSIAVNIIRQKRAIAAGEQAE